MLVMVDEYYSWISSCVKEMVEVGALFSMVLVENGVSAFVVGALVKASALLVELETVDGEQRGSCYQARLSSTRRHGAGNSNVFPQNLVCICQLYMNLRYVDINLVVKLKKVVTVQFISAT